MVGFPSEMGFKLLFIGLFKPSPLGRVPPKGAGEVCQDFEPLPSKIGSEEPIFATFPKGEGFREQPYKLKFTSVPMGPLSAVNGSWGQLRDKKPRVAPGVFVSEKEERKRKERRLNLLALIVPVNCEQNKVHSVNKP